MSLKKQRQEKSKDEGADMLERIRDIICQFSDVKRDEIVSEAKLMNEIGLNSLDVVNVIVAFEEEFEIEIPDEDIKTFITIKDIMVYIENKLA